jgi:hypothetical protein
MHRTLYTLCASILAFSAYSQISGKILDETSQPLPTANVVLYQGDIILSGASTNLEGEFEIKSPPAGSYRL